jgi:hypothetical protein
MCVGPEITRTVLGAKPSEAKAGPIFTGIHFNKEEAFVVAKGDIIPRTKFLNEPAFEQKGLRLGMNGVPLQIPDGLQKGARLGIGSLPFRRHKVLRGTPFEVSSFSHINHPVEPVAHDINAGFVGQIAQLGPEIGALWR